MFIIQLFDFMCIPVSTHGYVFAQATMENVYCSYVHVHRDTELYCGSFTRGGYINNRCGCSRRTWERGYVYGTCIIIVTS